MAIPISEILKSTVAELRELHLVRVHRGHDLREQGLVLAILDMLLHCCRWLPSYLSDTYMTFLDLMSVSSELYHGNHLS